MPDTPRPDSCHLIRGQARPFCEGTVPEPRDPMTKGPIGDAADEVKRLAHDLIQTLTDLLAPKEAWAPAQADNALYAPFLWLGQHLAIAIFMCVVVVCGLTAWQGSPRLRQMGASTGWTLAAVAGMASVPGIVMLLNRAVSSAFTAAFSSNEGTLFGAIEADLEKEAGHPLSVLIIVSALVVALAFAALVFMTRQPGMIVFVCIAPLVLASLARGGDMDAVKRWAQRLLGLLFAPFALLIAAPFVPLVKGSVIMDGVLLVACDALMLRMIFHGVPYFGPRIARAARAVVEQRTSSPIAHAVVRAGAPDVYEREDIPRGPRTVDTPGRAMGQDRGVLLAAYGVRQQPRPGRLTADSAAAQVREGAARAAQLHQARRDARAAQPPAPPAPRGPAAGVQQAPTRPRPARPAGPPPQQP
ncbi:hypothetical protein ABZ135_36895 [Streptomyces sp. NPDC006339]|uniref:hypothetical protein n=1 Tax=Streptomyces sp. NPDC006339 TaxID=3156755 RepID=UPI0033BBEDF7